MFPHGKPRLSLGFLLQSLIDLHVRDRCRCGREFVGFGAAKQGLLLNIFKDAAKLLVAGRSGDHGMKPHILFDMFQLVTVFKKFLCAVDAGREIVEQLWRDVGGVDGMDFEALAKFVQVAYLLRGELPNVSAAPWFNADETFGFQPIQRLTYGRLADSKLRCKRFLGEPGKFAQGSIEQVLLNAPIGEFGKIWDFRQLNHDRYGFRGFYTTRWYGLLQQ